MMYKKITLLVFSIIFSTNLIAQNINDIIVYNWHDQLVGFENLNINNGKIHTNYDITLNKEHRYFKTSEFVIGSLEYENQYYSNQKLKYDIANDELILSPQNETEYIKINVFKENVTFFSIYGQKFVNINTKEFNGFLEEHLVKNDKILYIKHFKENKELLQNEKVYKQYFYKLKYIISYNNMLTEITSKRSLIKIFPKYESEIIDFYKSNEVLKKENETKFMENLLLLMSNFS